MKKLLTTLSSVAFLFVFVATAFAAHTVVVTGDTAAGENEPGWLFNRDTSTSTPYEFNTDEASIGVGSLYVEPIGSNPADKFIGEYFYLDSADELNEFSYDFKIAGNGDSSDANHFYLNVYANLPGTPVDNFYDCRFDYTPSSGSTAAFTTFTVDGDSVPAHVQSRGGADCPTPSEGLNGLPEDSSIRAFSINVGDTSDSDEGLAGYLDNVVVDTTEHVTTYDFEPATTPEDKNECKDGGWMTFNTPEFKNQGQCVSYVASDGKSRNNPGKGNK